MTIYEGVLSILHPHPIRHVLWAYLALGLGVIFDAASLIYGVRKFREQNRAKRFWEAVGESKDPTTFMVLAEDSAAIVGELIAATSISLATRGFLAADGIGSILIGLLLATVAVFLIVHTRHLVIGEAVEKEIDQAIRELSTGQDKFSFVRRIHTMHFGPEDVLVTIDLEFDPRKSAEELMEAVDHIQIAIRERFPAVKYIYVDPEFGRRQDPPDRAPGRLAVDFSPR